MHKLLTLAIVLALPATAMAAQRDCLISFSGAQQDVCTGTAAAVSTNLDGLLSLSAFEASTLRVVKFDGPITEQQRRAVEAAGASILRYAPYYAYIVRMPPARDAALRQIKGVIWSGPLAPALKVDANIYGELKQGGIVQGLGVDALAIDFDRQAGSASVQNAIAGISGLALRHVVNVAGETRVQAAFDRVQLASVVDQLARRDDVLSIGFHKPTRLYNSQGHWLHQSGKNTPTPLMPIWDQGLYGCGQIVGELDTGLWMDNVAFKDASQTMPVSVCAAGAACTAIAAPNDNARKVVAYYKWSGLAGSSWGDDHGHGTHVAGSIIGNDNVSNPGTDCVGFTTPGGDTNLDGMAPGAKLVMQESGGNLAYLNDFGGTPYHAADIAYQNGARIHSNSWGEGCTDLFGMCISGCTVTYDDSARDADRAMHDHDDLLMVFAAGNDATACPAGNNVGSPGNAKNVLTIGANGRGTAGNNMASFSSRGPTLDARTKPDLDAQGSNIVSAGRSANGTVIMSGTSMATPTAAGLAALVRDYLARGFYPDGQKNPADAISDPSGALIKAIMASGAVDMTGSGAGASPGQSQGFGRILLDNSLYFSGDADRLFIHDDIDGLQTAGVGDHTLTVTDGSDPFTVILTWTDVAAAVGASPATVNSLRLEVQAPNGDVWTQKLPVGYSVNNANPSQSTATSNYDDLNTLQRIRLSTPQTGTYLIRVRGINVPLGPQTYALAATGRFDISTDPDFSLSAASGSVSVCAGSTALFDIGVRSLYGFTDPVTLGVSGLPGASSGSFSPNPVTPAFPAASSQLSIANTAGLARGSYGFVVRGTTSGATPLSHDLGAQLKVSVGMPLDPVLLVPANGDVDVARSPAFDWTDDVAAENYAIEVATDSGFANIVASGTPTDSHWTLGTPLAPSTGYYWRVKANSACGNSAWSSAFSFTTGVTFPEPYCPVTFPSAVEPITRVVFAGIDNLSSAVVDGSPALEDFLGISGGVVQAGLDYTLTAEGNTAGTYATRINAFIDWDRNGSFDATETYVIGGLTNSTGSDGKQVTATITVPATATPGPVRMRVIKRYSVAAQPCNDSGYGQAEDYTLTVQSSGPSYHVGGTVSGSTGSGLALKLNGGAAYAVGAGAYTFPDPLPDGSTYAVTIATVPAGQGCNVVNGSGSIAGADVGNVDVTCTTLPPNPHSIGGKVTGLTAPGLVLQLNGAQTLTQNSNGIYAFNPGLSDGDTYAITVLTQPTGLLCVVSNASGTMGPVVVTDVDVGCLDAASEIIFQDGFEGSP